MTPDQAESLQRAIATENWPAAETMLRRHPTICRRAAGQAAITISAARSAAQKILWQF